MSQVFENNMSFLKQHNPRLYNKILKYKNGEYKPLNTSISRISIARHEEIIINMLVESGGKEYLICDHENPIQQAYEWIDKYINPSSKCHVVFGMGFGYHLEVLTESFKDKKIIVIEPNIDLFFNILQVRNLKRIIAGADIYVDEDMTSIMEIFSGLLWAAEKGGIQCQPFDVYTMIFDLQWEEVRSKFIKRVQSFTVDIATIKAYGELWVHNTIKNAFKIVNASNAGGLSGQFKGIPGILVSGGPSLDKNISLIGKMHGKCIVMAAGSAVLALEKAGITPHFMVGIDATEEEAKMHSRVSDPNIYFLYSNQIATGSTKGYKGPAFLMNYSSDEFTKDFFKYAKVSSDVFSGGPSVANTAFDLLYKMGCNPIILTGQDLSFKLDSVYAEGIDSSDTGTKREGLIECSDIYGDTVYTRTDFISMKNWFEGYFEKVSKDVEIINATEGGLDIKLAGNETLKAVNERIVQTDIDIPKLINDIHTKNMFRDTISKRLSEYTGELLAELSRLKKYIKEQEELLGLIDRGAYHPSKDRRAFEKAASDVARFTERVLKSHVFGVLLKNMIGMDFFLVKRELEEASKTASSYEDMRKLYVDALNYQNGILSEKISIILFNQEI